MTLLDGELAYHQGAHDDAYGYLREAVELNDNLSYTEPWAWMHLPRHALAALLLDQRCARHPDNVWALHGLVEYLKRRGEATELADHQRKLTAALAKTDMVISSSCLCRTSVLSTPGVRASIHNDGVVFCRRCFAARRRAGLLFGDFRAQTRSLCRVFTSPSVFESNSRYAHWLDHWTGMSVAC
jgi:hypothetical protein